MLNELMMMPSFYLLVVCVIAYLLRATVVGFKLYKTHVIDGEKVEEDIPMGEVLIFAPLAVVIIFSFMSIVQNMQDIYDSDAERVITIISYYDGIAKNEQLGAEINQSALYALKDIQAKLLSNDRLNGLELAQIIERKNEFEKKRIFLKDNTSN